MQDEKRLFATMKSVKKWSGRWVNEPEMREMSFAEPQTYAEEYRDTGAKRGRIASYANDLMIWHFAHYLNSSFDDKSRAIQDLALSARYAHAVVKFSEAYAEANRGGSLVLASAAAYLSLNVIVGWKREADSIARSLCRGLDTTLLDVRTSDEHAAGQLYRHVWFVLQLYCSARNLPLDTSKYSYPRDMRPYAAVLADWRTTDLKKVEAFVDAMADFHLAEARPTAHDEIAEFDTEDRMLFPHEILTFLRFREWAGLENPTSFEHPLMNQPLAWLPRPTPLPQPDTPLLDAVVARFRDEFPGSFEASQK